MPTANLDMVTAEEAAQRFPMDMGDLSLNEFFELLVNDFGLRFGERPDKQLHYRAEYLLDSLARHRLGQPVGKNQPKPVAEKPARGHKPTKVEGLIAIITEAGGCLQSPAGGRLYAELAEQLESTEGSVIKMVINLRQQGILEPAKSRGRQPVCLRLREQSLANAV